jgi:hypothetical protein
MAGFGPSNLQKNERGRNDKRIVHKDRTGRFADLGVVHLQLVRGHQLAIRAHAAMTMEPPTIGVAS